MTNPSSYGTCTKSLWAYGGSTCSLLPAVSQSLQNSVNLSTAQLLSVKQSQACNNVLDLSMASLPIHGGLWRAWLSRGFLVVPSRSCLGTPYLHWWRLPRIVYSCLTNPRRQMLCFRLVIAYTLNEDMTTMRLASAAITGTLFNSYTMCNGPECPTGSSGTVIHICMNTTTVNLIFLPFPSKFKYK